MDKAYDFAKNDSGTTLEKDMLLPGTPEDHKNCPMLLPTPKIVRGPQSLKMVSTSLSVKLSKRPE